jgi:hypothetical protein
LVAVANAGLQVSNAESKSARLMFILYYTRGRFW